LNIHLSTFVPKSHTPFMWTTQISLAESRRRIGYIRNQLKGNRSIRVKWNQPELSWLEGIFSRGDRRLITPLVEAWKMGARFDAWGENSAMDIWLKALESSDLDPDFYLNRSRSVNEFLPWDHIRSGVTKEFFRREWERALSEKHTPDCRKQCLECGVCNHRDIDPRLCEEWSLPSSTGKPFPDRSEGVKKKYRLTFSKTGYARYLSHLELSRVFIRAIRRAGLKIAFSEGYHPMPKLSFPSALPVGTESVHETVDLELYENTEAHLLKKELNLQLPEGIWIVLAEDISLKKRGRIPVETHYRIGLNGLTVDPSCLERFLDSEFFPIEKRSSKGNRDVDARSLVKSLSFISPGALSLVIRHIPGPEIRPIQIVKEIFQIRDDDLLHIKILKIKEILG
jgi:radical SAM-linked protein